MRLLFDAERLRNPNSGLGQFCRALGGALMTERPADATVSFIVPPAQVGQFGNAATYLPTAWWHRFRSPASVDVWHAAHQDAWSRPPADARVVLSIMDLNFLERAEYSDAKKARRLAAVQRKVDRASAIATISAYTASVVRAHLRVPDIPLEVIHLGNPIEAVAASRITAPADPLLASLAGKRFFVFVGVLHPKKNVHTLLPILSAFPDRLLVLAGPVGNPYVDEIRRGAEELGVSNRLLIPGAVDEATKRWLYEHSDALLFPSLSEGFGLPVLEAMSFGKPVFLSRLTSLPEIGGSLACYFDSFEAESMVATVRRGLAEFDAAPDRPQALRAYAETFSWKRAAMSYWTLYTEALRSPIR